MGLRGTLVLLVVLGALVGALWWSSGRDPGTDVVTLTESALDGRSLGTAVHLTVRPRMDVPAYEFGRERAGPWMLEEPVVDFAAAGRLEQIRIAWDAAVLLPVYEPDQIDATILAETGLATPKALLVARWPDDREIRVEIGDFGPFGHDRFVRRDGRIFRADQSLFTVLEGNVSDWRDRYLFRHQDATVVRDVRIERRVGVGAGAPVETIVLRSDPREGWVMESPLRLRLDQLRAASLVTNLLTLQAREFLDGGPGELIGPVDPEARPDVAIDISGGLGRERVELSSLPAPDTWIGRATPRDVWFLADRGRYDQLVEWRLEDLRARWVIGQSIDELQAVRIRVDGADVPGLELGRDPLGAFRLERPVGGPADPTAVAELLNALRNVVALRFVDEAGTGLDRYGLAAGHRIVELVGPRRTAPEILHVGAPTGDGRVYLRRADEPYVLEIERALADVLARPWTVYVGLDVLEIVNSGSVASMVGTAGDAAVRYVRDDRGLWRRDGAEAPSPEATELFDLLRDLRAREVLDPGVLDAARAPDARVWLESREGAELARLELFDGEGGDVLCRVVGRPGYVYRLGTLVGRSLELLRPAR